MSRLEREAFMLSIDTPTYKVIGVDEENCKNGRKHYLIQCKKCGTIFSRRTSIITENLDTVQCINCRRNRYGKPLNVLEYKMYCYYRSGARQRKHEWNLTESEFKSLISKNCHYCNEPPSERKTVAYKDDVACVNGIDRIDSKKGYSIDNCVTCCTQCNRMKNTFSHNDFINKISQIYNHYIKSSTTIPKGSTSQANGDGSGSLLTSKVEDEDIV
jgi:hypothetical protein